MSSEQFPDVEASVPEVTAQALWERLESGESVTVLDTRRPEDFEAWTLTHPNVTNVNVPFTRFLEDGNPAASVPEEVPEGPLVTCCAKGISSLYVAKFLAREGWAVEGLADGMEGWARVYELTELEAESEAVIAQYYRPSSGCLGYLVVSDGEAAVIDPLRAFTDRYAEDARAYDAELRYAIDTHVHADHVSGLRALADRGVEPVLPHGAVDRGLTFEATLVEDGHELPLGEVTIETVPLPGHTTEMTGFRVDDVLVTGDSVFVDSVARPDLEDADAAREAAGTLYETLMLLADLPEETVLAPGHAGPTTSPRADGTYTATVGTLRGRLRAFRLDRETFVAETVADLPPQPKDYRDIIATNLGQTDVDDTEAFTLELGPNNCAAATPADD